MFSKIDIPLRYQVSVLPVSEAGPGETAVVYKEIDVPSRIRRGEDFLWVTLIKIGLVTLSVLIVAIAVFSILKRPKKRFYVVSTLSVVINYICSSFIVSSNLLAQLR